MGALDVGGFCFFSPRRRDHIGFLCCLFGHEGFWERFQAAEIDMGGCFALLVARLGESFGWFYLGRFTRSGGILQIFFSNIFLKHIPLLRFI